MRADFALLSAASVAVTLLLQPAEALAQVSSPPKKDAPAKGKAAPASEDEAKKDEKKPEGAKAEVKGEELKELDSSKRAVYMALDVGYTRPDLGGISDDTGLDRTSANGLLYGFGAGVRFNELRLGARYRGLDTTEFTLWELMAEVGYGLSMRPLSPALYLRAGYVFDIGVERGAFAKSLPPGTVLTPNVDVHGLVLGTELSAAYYVSKAVRVGPFIGLDFLFLSRPKVDAPRPVLPAPAETSQNPLFKDSGSGTGFALNLGLRGAFDVAF